MNTILYELKQFRQTVTIKDLSKYLGRNSDTFRSQIDRCRVNISKEEAEIMRERMDIRIRKLVKIKLLLDKELEGK